ncbi:hypothetical protein [Gorillibacterium timonense]|uniref:hypothetical protein n=1 Tax=Gorillibacterium timonense TaxID=1689269 RepID=UPI00071C75EE|nr:hypothetical protein [Gorillibacterium timonense]
MKTFTIILGAGAILLLLSTLLCGFWIANQNLTGADLKSALSFHKKLGITASLVSIAAILLMIFKYVK